MTIQLRLPKTINPDSLHSTPYVDPTLQPISYCSWDQEVPTLTELFHLGSYNRNGNSLHLAQSSNRKYFPQVEAGCSEF